MWVTVPLFVTVTVVPTGTVSVDGENAEVLDGQRRRPARPGRRGSDERRADERCANERENATPA